MLKTKQFLWTEKYRPSNVSECVLSLTIKEAFNSFIKNKNMPNLVLEGIPGIGKTTVALACLEEMNCDFIKINASLESGIDIVREKMMQFASTMSFNGGRKYILLDEADRLSSDAQEALRAFIDEYSLNCGFLFTCNDGDKIIDAIKSRCQVITFQMEAEEFVELGREFYNSLMKILDKENVSYEKPVLVQLIKTLYPDWRKILDTIQFYSIKKGTINSGILVQKKKYNIDTLLPLLKVKNWVGMRRWVGENYVFLDNFAKFAKALMEELEKMVEPMSFVVLVDIQNEYDFRNYFVVDKQVNLVAYLSKVINEASYKIKG